MTGRRWWSQPGGRAGLALTATLAVALSGAVVANRAEADTDGKMNYPAGATATRFAGKAFDTCAAPNLSTMRAWMSSPYRAIGVYVSGDLRACRQPNLTASWVREVTGMGWKLIPIDVGRQAPCTSFSLRISSDGSTARKQGKAAGLKAVRAARDLGMLPGSALYSDIENYDSANKSCSDNVRSYLFGWTSALHSQGYLSGAYGNLSSVVRTMVAVQRTANEGERGTSSIRPDMLWNAQWDRTASTTWSGVDSSLWGAHQRIKQYRGDHRETYGGITLTIDSNVADAAVATVAHVVPAPSGAEFVARAEPATIAAVRPIGGGSLALVCRADSSLPLEGTWVQTGSGAWLPESIFTGAVADALRDRLATCLTPQPLRPGTSPVRVGADDAAASPGALAGGTLAWIICELPGAPGGRGGYWQRLETGHWIDGSHLLRRNRTEDAPATPRCIP